MWEKIPHGIQKTPKSHIKKCTSGGKISRKLYIFESHPNWTPKWDV